MLMQTGKSQKPSRPAADKKPYCFPEFHAIQPRKDNGTDACLLFQPLFQTSGESDDRMTACTFGNQEDVDAADGQEAEAKRSYRRGFEAGQAEACNQVQNELVPKVSRFEKTLDSLAQDMHQIVTTSGEAIQALAFAIVEKILRNPAPAACTAGQDLHHMLRSALTSAYTLELVLNRDDYDLLNGLMVDRDLSERQHTLLPIACSEDVPRGGAKQQSQQLPMAAEQIHRFVDRIFSPS